jgi:hypothetical protein
VFLGYLIIVLALGVASIAIYRQHLRAEAVESQRELSVIGKLVSNELGDWLVERREDADYFSDPIIAGPIADLVSDRADEATRARLGASLDRLRVRHGAAALFLFDAQGAVRLAFPQGASLSDSTTSVVHEALSSRKVAVSELRSTESHRSHDIEFAGPVLVPTGDDAAAPAMVGVIVVRYEIEKTLGPILATWTQHSRTGRVLLVWPEANTWGWLDGSKETGNASPSADQAAEATNARHASQQPAALVWHEGHGTAEKVDLWQKVAGTPWRVIVQMDAREAKAGGSAPTYYLLALAFALALACILALHLWSARRDLAFERQLRAAQENGGGPR